MPKPILAPYSDSARGDAYLEGWSARDALAQKQQAQLLEACREMLYLILLSTTAGDIKDRMVLSIPQWQKLVNTHKAMTTIQKSGKEKP